jgi:hypothetical protein
MLGRAEHGTAGVNGQRAAANHPKGVNSRKAARRALAAASARPAEEGALPHSLQPRRLHISAPIHFEVMVRRHFIPSGAPPEDLTESLIIIAEFVTHVWKLRFGSLNACPAADRSRPFREYSRHGGASSQSKMQLDFFGHKEAVRGDNKVNRSNSEGRLRLRIDRKQLLGVRYAP